MDRKGRQASTAFQDKFYYDYPSYKREERRDTSRSKIRRSDSSRSRREVSRSREKEVRPHTSQRSSSVKRWAGTDRTTGTPRSQLRGSGLIGRTEVTISPQDNRGSGQTERIEVQTTSLQASRGSGLIERTEVPTISPQDTRGSGQTERTEVPTTSRPLTGGGGPGPPPGTSTSSTGTTKTIGPSDREMTMSIFPPWRRAVAVTAPSPPSPHSLGPAGLRASGTRRST